MCGILGFIGSPWKAHVEPAVATLRSRGPDAEAVLDFGEAVFAHICLAVGVVPRRKWAVSAKISRKLSKNACHGRILWYVPAPSNLATRCRAPEMWTRDSQEYRAPNFATRPSAEVVLT